MAWVLRVIDGNGNLTRVHITEFSADGPKVKLPDTDKIMALKCPHCGHHDFHDDGPAINYYTCDGCMSDILAY